MIQINLLPQKDRLEAVAFLKQMPWRRIGAGVLALLLFYSGWIFISNQHAQRQLKRYTEQWALLQDDVRQWDEVSAVLERKRRQATVSGTIDAPEALWAPRLNLLSDALVSGLWLIDMKLEQGKKPVLSLRGAALPGVAGQPPRGEPVSSAYQGTP